MTEQIMLCLLLCLALLVTAGLSQDSVVGEAPRHVAREMTLRPFDVGNDRTGQGWLETSNRDAVQHSFLTEFLPLSVVPFGFTGNIALGQAGTTSDAYKAAVLTRINWFRKMAGVPPVTFDAERNVKAQEAALMMSANNTVSHFPTPAWVFYTKRGAEAAAKSNLCLAFVNDPGCVARYIAEPGEDNSAVGHRRWILYPRGTLFGTGDVPSVAGYNSANALWVIDNTPGVRPSVRDEYIAWPPPGHVPYQVVYPRWSFSLEDADFKYASIAMTRDGVSMPVRIESTVPGYGESTLVWVPEGQERNALTSHFPTAKTSYDVLVTNVLVKDTLRSFHYRTVVFDPSIAANSLTLRSDFDHNGASDIVWQDDSTGQAAIWYYASDGSVASVNWLHAGGDPTWRIAAIADLNNDGAPDVVWQNPMGMATVWFLGGPTGEKVIAFAWLNSIEAKGWRVAATADFDRNGRVDIIWRNDTTGEIMIWYLGVGKDLVLEEVKWFKDSASDLSWRISAAADFNRDGKIDLLWSNQQTGQVSVWYLRGDRTLSADSFGWLAAKGDHRWQIAGVSDMNADGAIDAIWQNTDTRQVSVWFLGGSQGVKVIGFGWIHVDKAPGWTVIGPR